MSTTTTRPVVVTFGSPTEIVGMIPSMLGFHPTDSWVVMCLHGPRRRTGLTMRFDLVDAQHDQVLAVEAARRVAAEKAAATLLVCFTEAADDADRLPRAGLIDELAGQLLRRGIEVAEALLVRAGRWFSYTCSRPCCPRDGTPIPAVPEGAAARYDAERVLEGRAVLPSRETLEASVRPPVALRRIALAQVYDRVSTAVVNEIVSDGPGAFRRRTVALARSVLNGFVDGRREISDEDAARIVLGLRDKVARDELATWALDGRTDELIAFLSDLAQRAFDEDAAPVCTVLASVTYQVGGGPLTTIALERARRRDPGYEMARLLEAMLHGQLRRRGCGPSSVTAGGRSAGSCPWARSHPTLEGCRRGIRRSSSGVRSSGHERRTHRHLRQRRGWADRRAKCARPASARARPLCR
jgi:Domain of unknown function (DUF4192)